MGRPVAIVGGGIGGLTLAVALRARGVDCQVFERAPRIEEIGAGLLLSPNAVRVIRALKMVDTLSRRSVVASSWEILNPAGRRLSRVSPAQCAADCSLSTRRSDLQEVLLEALPRESVMTGQEMVGLRTEKGHHRIQWAAGGETEASLVVAADGAGSRLRHIFSPKVEARFQGYVGWRALVPWIPPGWESGRITESWGRGKRFGIAPVGKGGCYWYATTNEPAEEPSRKGRRERLRAHFSNWHWPAVELIERTPETAILRHPIRDLGVPRVFEGPPGTTVLGDAAHAMTPNLGQGCAMALEDAWELARHLAGGGDPHVSMRRFQHARCRRWRSIWAASRVVGRLIQCESPLLCGFRDVGVWATPNFVAGACLRRLLDFHPQEDVLASHGHEP